MKIDLYTKTMLTVIAIALAWLSLQPVFFPKETASAQGQQIQKVRLVDENGEAILYRLGGKSALPVRQIQ